MSLIVPPTQDPDKMKKEVFQKVLTKLGNYKVPPPVEIPDQAYSIPTPCTVLGFDKSGFIYVRFHGEFEEEHKDLMVMMNKLYSSAHLRFIAILDPKKLQVGDIIVALIEEDELESDEYCSKNNSLFFRGRILEIDPSFKNFVVVDIDDQMKHKVSIYNLFWIFDLFLHSPMMSIKCRVRYLDGLEGTMAVSEAANILIEPGRMMGILKLNNTDSEKPPIIELFHEAELKAFEKWSYNFELMYAVMSFNDSPLPLKKDMKLLDARITHATPEGQVWIQLQSGVMSAIVNLKPTVSLDRIRLDIPEKMYKAIQGRCLKYVLYSQSDKMYYRVQLLGPLTIEAGIDDPINVEFTDLGTKKVVTMKELIPYDFFPIEYQDIPPQVFEASLKSPTPLPVSLSDADIERLLQTKRQQQVIICQESSESSPCPTVSVYFLPIKKKSGAKKRGEKLQAVVEHADYEPFRLKVESLDHKETWPMTGFRYAIYRFEKTDGIPHWQFLK